MCSGAKSILDLPATREVLETQGVAVIGYQTDEIPAFFTRRSGITADVCAQSAAEVAAIIQARQSLQLHSGILVTVPVPVEAALDEAEMEAMIAQATEEADQLGVHGAAATPWLLNRIRELTGGRSLQANIALLRNNAFVAAQVAAQLSKLALHQSS